MTLSNAAATRTSPSGAIARNRLGSWRGSNRPSESSSGAGRSGWLRHRLNRSANANFIGFSAPIDAPLEPGKTLDAVG